MITRAEIVKLEREISEMHTDLNSIRMAILSVHKLLWYSVFLYEEVNHIPHLDNLERVQEHAQMIHNIRGSKP